MKTNSKRKQSEFVKGLPIKEYQKQHHARKKAEDPDYFRNRSLKQKYGITVEDYNKLLVSQDSKCAGCGKIKEQILFNKLYVDHCHTTGEVRGLLCSKCNTALGMVNDDIDILSNLISYLKETKE